MTGAQQRGRPRHCSPALPPSNRDSVVRLGVVLTVQELEVRAVQLARTMGHAQPGKVMVELPKSEVRASVSKIWPQLKSRVGFLNTLRHYNRTAEELERHKQEAVFPADLCKYGTKTAAAMALVVPDRSGRTERETNKQRRKDHVRYLKQQIEKATIEFLEAGDGSDLRELFRRELEADHREISHLVCSKSSHRHTREAIAEHRSNVRAHTERDAKKLAQKR